MSKTRWVPPRPRQPSRPVPRRYEQPSTVAPATAILVVPPHRQALLDRPLPRLYQQIIIVTTAAPPVTLPSVFRHGKGIQPLIDERDMSPILREVKVSALMETDEITDLSMNDRAFVPALREATLSFDGLFAASTVAADDIVNYLDDALGGSTSQVVTVDFERSTGGRAAMMRTDATKYDISSPMDDIVSVAVDAQGSDGYAGGRMLRPLSAASATGSNGAILTPGTTTVGGTTNGGVAHFHLTAQSTLGSLTAKVQH